VRIAAHLLLFGVGSIECSYVSPNFPQFFAHFVH
jgi:hypothetical protein